MKLATQPDHQVKTIAAGEFKAKCLQLMDDVNAGKLTVVITKHGKPVSQLVPPPQEDKPFWSIVGRTPGVRIPTQKEWAKVKEEWTAEWDDSTDHLVKLLKTKSKKNKQQ